MFSRFLLPGLLLAIGVSGIVWWALKEWTRIPPSKADGISVMSGLAVAFFVSLIERGFIKEPLQLVVAFFVLILSYGLIQFEKTRFSSLRKKKDSAF